MPVFVLVGCQSSLGNEEGGIDNDAEVDEVLKEHVGHHTMQNWTNNEKKGLQESKAVKIIEIANSCWPGIWTFGARHGPEETWRRISSKHSAHSSSAGMYCCR